MPYVTHVFKDGSTDPTKKTVPAELVRRIYEIRVRAEANAKARKDGGRDDAHLKDEI